MKQHNKLVRDKIPKICEENGDTPHYHIIEDNEEYLEALFKKDGEESVELREDRSLDELADKLEVLYATAKALGYSPGQLEEARAEKAEARGSFEGRIFLEYTD
jgi:predicted house-cleaning noncanonical NTP pyrophosphatase (MazG superfamily)